MLSALLVALAVSDPAASAISAPIRVVQDSPVEIWLSRRENLDFGDRLRVYVKAENDGHLVVLHADPEGRVRVLFPLDPFQDDFIRGGRNFEIRSRRDREAMRVVEATGFGTVYAAYSTDPFRYDEFVRNDHWDYRVFGDVEINGDSEQELTEIVQRMAVGRGFDYDVTDYYVNDYVAARRYGRDYGYAGHYDPYWDSPHFGFGINVGFGPFYYGYYPYGYYGHRRSYASLYWGSYYYDPYYYDPFYYGSYYGGYYYRPYYAGYYRPYRTYVVVPTYASGRYYGVNPRYTLRNRAPVQGVEYRRRLSAPGVFATSGRRVAATPGRAVARRAGQVSVGRVTTARRTPVSVSSGGRRAAPTAAQRSGRIDTRRNGSAGTIRTAPQRTPERRTAQPAATSGASRASPQRSNAGRQPTSSGRRPGVAPQSGSVRRSAPTRPSSSTAEARRAPEPAAVRETAPRRATSSTGAVARRAPARPTSSLRSSQARSSTSSQRRVTPRAASSAGRSARPSAARAPTRTRAAPVRRSASVRSSSRPQVQRSAPRPQVQRSAPRPQVRRSAPARTSRPAARPAARAPSRAPSRGVARSSTRRKP